MSNQNIRKACAFIHAIECATQIVSEITKKSEGFLWLLLTLFF